MTSEPAQQPLAPRGQRSANVTSTLAGVLMCIAGTFEFLQGLTAITRNDLYVVTNNYILKFDTTAWGWIHIILGIVSIAIGVAILARAMAGQILGIMVAALLMITNFASMPYYPLWSLVIIAFNVLVIWALIFQLRNDEAERATGPRA